MARVVIMTRGGGAGEGGSGGVVTSVNGATGDVVLRAISIPEDNHGNVQAALNDAADRLGDVEEVVGHLTTLTTLDIAVYGDFHAPEWLTLDDGTYYLEGGGSQYTNAPFDVGYSSYIYGCELAILNGAAHYLHKMTVVVTGEQLPPQVYWRAGESALGDMILRGWSRLDNTNTSKYMSVYTGAYTSGEYTLSDGTAMNLTEQIVAATATTEKHVQGRLDGTRTDTPAGVVLEGGGVVVRIPYLASMQYQHITLQVRLDGTVSGLATSQRTARVYLRRASDGSVVTHINLMKDDATSLDNITGVLTTWVDGDTDTFIADGLYLTVENDSGRTMHITGMQLLIQAG